MPKSAFAANSQAKACAFAVASALGGAEASRPFLYNTCYTFLAPDDAVSDAIAFKVADGKIGIADILISQPDESAAIRAQDGPRGGWLVRRLHPRYLRLTIGARPPAPGRL